MTTIVPDTSAVFTEHQVLFASWSLNLNQKGHEPCEWLHADSLYVEAASAKVGTNLVDSRNSREASELVWSE